MREIEHDLLRLVAELPLVDRIELALLSRWSERAVYQRLGDLRRAGLVEDLPHASELIRPTRRFLLSARGIERLALTTDRSREMLLRDHPISEQWRRMLAGRLDAAAVIYRLACALAAVDGPPRLRWYRSQPADAALALPDAQTLAVVRWGRTADRTAFAVRMSRLREGALYSAALLLVPDEVRLRQARRLARGMPFICFLALERDAAESDSEDDVWRTPTGSVLLSLRETLSYARPGGEWAVETVPRRPLPPRSLAAQEAEEPDWLLLSRFKPSEKRCLELIGDWPWIKSDHLGLLLGVERRRVSQLTAALEWHDLATAPRIDGHRRLVLSDRGLTLLARRDRASVGAARKRWSASLVDPDAPFGWRNLRGRRSRQLLRHLTHTEAVHGFLAALAAQARSNGRELTQIDPPHRASRYFRFEDRLHSVQPDAFGVLRRDGRDQPFFLEWERRAIRPSTMAAKVAPYLRYYATHRPTDDHGAEPLVLVAVEDPLAADHFLRVSRKSQERTDFPVPLWVSDCSTLAERGPLGPAWRSRDCPIAERAFAERSGASMD